MSDPLSNYFDGVAAKRLRATEVDILTSHGHEFQGVSSLRSILGDVSGSEKVTFTARFIYLGYDESETLIEDGLLTWYDSRANDPNRSTEMRLYVVENPVYAAAEPDDLLIVGKRTDGTLLVVIARGESTAESQLKWLFNLSDDLSGFSVQDARGRTKNVGYAERFVLNELGIDTIDAGEDWLSRIDERFDSKFPPTRLFSDFARETFGDLDVEHDPDFALVEWMNHEELLFRTLERHLVNKHLDKGFDDVDDFVRFSLSVHNRRKSRAGYALENHLEAVFTACGLQYGRDKKTENKSRPDFLFPGIDKYRDEEFSSQLLTMLGAKSTCKDRWRQVLTEAKRIPHKHLLTLEPGISVAQTAEMQSSKLQLVLPSPLHETYSVDQRDWLLNLQSFIDLVHGRQGRSV